MADTTQYEQALIKAHRNGDDRAAKLIASKIQQQRADGYFDGAPADEATFGEKVFGGLKHSWDKAAYGLEGAVKGLFGGDMSPESKERLAAGKAFVNRAGGAAKVAEFAGDVLPYVATGAGAVRAGLSLPTAMAAQGMTGAVVTPEDLAGRLKSGALATAGEGIGGYLLPKAMSKLANGVGRTEAAQRMIDEGIYPTLGGMKGGVVKSLEDKALSIPLFGDAIAMGRKNAINQFNDAALRRGGIPEEAVNQIGHDGFSQLDDYFNKQFGDALGGVRFDMTDPRIQQAIDRALQQRGAQADTIDAVNGFFRGQYAQRGINPNPAPGNSLMNSAPVPTLSTGQDFHNLLRDIRTRSQALRKSSNIAEQDAGYVLRGMYDDIQGIAGKQGYSDPGALDAFNKVRQQYAAVAPAYRAGQLNTVATQQGGIFSPKQYANANANNMKAMGQVSQLRQGQGYNQQFADDAVKTLGNNYPDSGTAGRMLLGLEVGGSALMPSSLVASVPALAAVAGLNTQIGRKALAGATAPQKALSKALENYTPYAGTIGAALMGGSGR